MIGRYRMSDGCIYEVYEVVTGKGRTKQSHFEMRCIEGGTKVTGLGFPTTEEYFNKLNQFNLITKLQDGDEN